MFEEGEEQPMSKRRHCGRAVLLLMSALLVAAPNLGAQQQASPSQNPKDGAQPQSSIVNTDFTRTGVFPNILAPYTSPNVPPQRLGNSARLYELLQNGTIKLTLQDAIALALENNLDIDLSRYNMAYAQTDVVRAASGAATRGVTGAFASNAVFAGAVGGGIGTASGGGGGNGAGSATGGSGGAFNIGPIGTFDPVVGFTAGYDDRLTPLGTNTVTGTGALGTHTTTYTGFLGQELPTGTSYAISLGGTRQSTSAFTNFYNPQLSSGLTIAASQNLLNGFGYRANAKFIRIAANDVGLAKSVFRQQVITTITQIENDYWNLATAQENVRVAKEAVAYAQKLLEDNKRQEQIGTLAPIDVVQAESQLATAQTNMVVAQTGLLQQQSILETALSRRVDKTLENASIQTADPLPKPTPDDIPSLDDALQLALQSRPEVEQDVLNLKNEDIILKANRNALLPTLQLYGAWRPSALGGALSSYATTPIHIGNQLIQPSAGGLPGGVGNMFTQMFQNFYPDYSVGITLQMPIRNRQAQADAARALLEARSLRTQAQQHINTVQQDVRNAVIAVTQAKAQIDSAAKAVDYAQQILDAEQKKFKLGESTVFNVIQQQNNLTSAEGTLVKAYSTYAQAITQYAQATGTTLKRNNIEIDDAVKGTVSKIPNIPGTPTNQGTH